MPTPQIFTSVINSYLPEPHASLLNGILFGINIKTTKTFYEQLKIVGLLHIVVLSGINITLLSSIVSGVTIFFGKRISTMLTILTIILFIIFVGPQAPIVRAGFMGILTLVAVLYGRKNFSLYAMFLSIVFIAIFWPKWLTSLSFYLSYAATLGIILFGQVKSQKTKSLLKALWHGFWKEFKPSLAAQIFTAPVIFFYFKQISLIAPFSNVLIAPVIPLLMVFGLATAVLGKINFYLGLLPAWVCYLFLNYIVFVVDTLAKIPKIFIKF